MKTFEHLAKYYQITKKLMGPIAAKEDLSTAIYLVICDLQEEGLEITAELLEERLYKYAQDFIEVAEKTNVA